MQKNQKVLIAGILYIVLLSIVWYLRLQVIMTVALSLVGSIVGFLLPIVLDVLLPRMMDGSAKVDGTFAKDILHESADQLKQGNIHATNAPQTPLRSYPLLVAYFAAAIFVITSTQNWFGRGFVLGLGFSLVADIFFSRAPGILRERWFSVFRTNLTDGELQYFVAIVIGAFALLSVFAAFA